MPFWVEVVGLPSPPRSPHLRRLGRHACRAPCSEKDGESQGARPASELEPQAESDDYFKAAGGLAQDASQQDERHGGQRSRARRATRSVIGALAQVTVLEAADSEAFGWNAGGTPEPRPSAGELRFRRRGLTSADTPAVATTMQPKRRECAFIARSSCSEPPRLNQLNVARLAELSKWMTGRGNSKPWWRRGALLRGIPKHYSVRTRLRMALQFSPLGTAWEVFQTLFAVLVSALYVVETYRPEVALSAFDSVALGVFGVDYALNLYCSESRCDHPLRYSIPASSNLTVCVPLVSPLASGSWSASWG